jgi:hypothetical protein
VAREVLRILRDEDLVSASAAKGERLLGILRDALADQPLVGEFRGRGLLVGVELVADQATRRPAPRSVGLTEAVVRAARDRGVLLYSGTGLANGVDGDAIILGPPFVVTEAELDRIGVVLREAIDAAAEVLPASPTAATTRT